jgi:signal transduction histidine kinase
MEDSDLVRFLNDLPYGLALIDSGRRVLYANPVMGKMEEDWEGVGELVSRGTSEGPGNDPGRAVEEAFRNGSVSRVVHSFRDRRDRPRVLKMTFFPVFQEGRAARCAVLSEEVTEEDSLQNLKEEYVRVLAHDFRNLCQSMDFLSLSHPRAPEGMPGKDLKRVNSDCQILMGRVEDLLDVYRAESGGLLISRTRTQLGEMIQQAVEQVRELAADRRVVLRVEVGRHLPPVPCDGSKLLRALTSLLEHAVRNSPSGEEVLVDAAKKGTGVEVSVSDRGAPLPEEEREWIFDMGYQGRRAAEGHPSGIGLPVCRQIIAAHGGEIRVESPLPGADLGKRFHFTLPL